MNANTAHPAETRAFLEWLTTPEFSQLFIENQPVLPAVEAPGHLIEPACGGIRVLADRSAARLFDCRHNSCPEVHLDWSRHSKTTPTC